MKQKLKIVKLLLIININLNKWENLMNRGSYMQKKQINKQEKMLNYYLNKDKTYRSNSEY